MAYIKTKDLNNKYIKCENINININKKDFVALTGNDILNKTAILNMLNLSLKIDSGNIFIDSINIDKFDKKKINDYKNSLGIVMDELSFSDDLNLIDIFLLFGYDKSTVFKYFNKFDVLKIKDYYFSELREIEKRKAMLILALIKKPSILMIDNFDCFDLKTRKLIIKIAEKMVNEENKIAIISSNDNNVINSANKIINICDGKINIAVKENKNEKVEKNNKKTKSNSNKRKRKKNKK